MLPSMFIMEAQPSNPTQSRETTPWPDGNWLHGMVPSWNSSDGPEKSDKSPSTPPEPDPEELDEEAVAADEDELAAADGEVAPADGLATDGAKVVGVAEACWVVLAAAAAGVLMALPLASTYWVT